MNVPEDKDPFKLPADATDEDKAKRPTYIKGPLSASAFRDLSVRMTFGIQAAITDTSSFLESSSEGKLL